MKSLVFAPLLALHIAAGVFTTVAVAAPSAAPAQQPADSGGAQVGGASGVDPTQSRNAARSRMRECGHQWSSMKKNGSAGAMTWKDFSQGCLAKQ